LSAFFNIITLNRRDAMDQSKTLDILKNAFLMEKNHLKQLMAIEASLIEDVWNDSSFWPF